MWRHAHQFTRPELVGEVANRDSPDRDSPVDLAHQALCNTSDGVDKPRLRG